MTKQDNYKCSLILAPANEDDIRMFENSYYALYALYKNNKSDKIQVGIPGMENHTSLHNMDNFESANEKAYFINLGYSGIELADIITERPVYVIEVTDDRTVKEYTIINGYDTDLESLLNNKRKRYN